MSSANQVDPIAVFESLTVEAIDKSINELQAEIDELIGPRQKRLEALTALRNVIYIRENGKKQRKPRKSSATEQSKPAATATDGMAAQQMKDRIIGFLVVNGAAKPAVIAEQLGKESDDSQMMGVLRDHRVFKQDSWGRFGLVKR